MLRFSWFPIKRHTLVKRYAAWDDPELEEYWAARQKRRRSKSSRNEDESPVW